MFLWLFVFVSVASAALVFDCGTVPTVPQDRRSNKTQLTLAHWNVEWLFLEDWPKRWESDEQARQHAAAIAAIMWRNRHVDIWHLAEVEDCGALRELARLMGDATLRPYLVPGRDSATGQHVGLLSRLDPTALFRSETRVSYPVKGSKCDAGKRGSTGVSKHLVAEFRPEGGVVGPFSIIGAHLLARPLQRDRCARREGQAAVLQQLIKAQLLRTNNRVVVMGDLNEFDSLVPDVKNSVPLSRTLALLKDVLPERPGDELHNVARSVHQGQRFTSYYHGESDVCLPAHASSSSLDHVLVSEALLPTVTNARFGNSDFHPPCRADRQYSDHWPIFITLQALRAAQSQQEQPAKSEL
jgi:endonuclease/exonuclease/phosphatase family metal-dependent hydrolase